MADTNEAAQRIKAHADSLASVPHNAQFRADLYELCEQATPPADAALAEYCERAARNWTKGCDMHIGLMCAAAALRARPQAVAEGFVLVPVEPTEQQLDAGDGWSCAKRNELRSVYVAMLAASQSATGGAT